jgi:hypothetical protein
MCGAVHDQTCRSDRNRQNNNPCRCRGMRGTRVAARTRDLAAAAAPARVSAPGIALCSLGCISFHFDSAPPPTSRVPSTHAAEANLNASCFGPVRRVPIPNRYTAKAKLCFCKNNKRRIIMFARWVLPDPTVVYHRRLHPTPRLCVIGCIVKQTARTPLLERFWFPKSLESWLRLSLVYCNTKDNPLQTSGFPINVVWSFFVSRHFAFTSHFYVSKNQKRKKSSPYDPDVLSMHHW